MLALVFLLATCHAFAPVDEQFLDVLKMMTRMSRNSVSQKNRFTSEATCAPEINPCDPTSCDLEPLTAFPTGPCIKFFANLAGVGLVDEIKDGNLTVIKTRDLGVLYDLTCAEDACMNAFFDVIGNVSNSPACKAAPADQREKPQIPALFTLICSEKAIDAACTPYIVDSLAGDATIPCIASYDKSTATVAQKREVACCLMNNMQCCYPTLKDSYALVTKMQSDLGLDLADAIANTCPSVSSIEACRNPFLIAKYASLGMKLAEFKASDLPNLITDLAKLWKVNASALSVTQGNTTTITRRRRFETLATSTDLNVSVYIGSTSQDDLLTSMNADLNYADLTTTMAGNSALGNGATTVTKSQAAVETTEVPPYVPRGYTISSSAKSLHSWPRLQGTNEATLESTGDGLQNWVTGLVASVLGPFLTIGILIFLCLPCVHCIRNAKCDNTCTGKPSKIFFLVMLLLITIGCFLGFLSSAATGSAVTGLAGGFGDLGGLFGNAIDFVDAADVTALKANVSLAALKGACNPATDAVAIGYIDATITQNNKVLTSLRDFRGTAKPLQGQLTDIETTLTEFNPTRESVTYMALGFALVTFILGAIHEMQMMRDGGGFKCTYYIVMLLGMVVMLGAWTSGGLNALLGVLISDICQDPVTVMSSAMTDAAQKNEFQNLFYCNLKSEMFAYLDKAHDLIPLIQLELTRVQFAHDDGACQGANFDSLLATANTDEAAMIVNVQKTFKSFACPELANIFSNVVYDSMCTDFPAGAELFLGASCMVGIFGLFALCVFRKETVEK